MMPCYAKSSPLIRYTGSIDADRHLSAIRIDCPASIGMKRIYATLSVGFSFPIAADDDQ